MAPSAARHPAARRHAADPTGRSHGAGGLASAPSNRLEALSGDRAGQWSIRINGQWRVCFRFERGHAQDVEIVDYH
ncbi:type II toxin-antitoxin system RelE/ParE family toxin [Ottowia pentelensis]|uniref:type II toxin-antitoxin system RelE/ParE family toxin n=1 Tax=Ottowia pentelensis TaxID=511108 RepID=UPI00362DE59C